MESKGRYGQFIRWIFAAVDFVVLNVAYLFTCWWNDISDGFCSRPVWLMLNVSFLAILNIFSSIHARRVVYADRVLLRAIKTVALHAAVFLALLSFLNVDYGSGRIVAKFYLLFFSCLGFWWILSRKVIKWYRSRGFNYRRIVVIGGGVAGDRLISELKSDAGYGYRVMGVFDDRGKSAGSADAYAGRVADVEEFVKSHTIDEMYCTIPETDDEVVTSLIRIAEGNAIDFYYVPQFGRHLTRRFELESIGNVPVLSIRPYPLSNPFNRIVKRGFDLLVSSVVMLLSPLVLVPVAIGIKLSSPGPVFFKQKRTGYRGRPFNCYKFRTMRVNAESDTRQASKGDPRTTRFGEFLRHTSVDELPQFYNVWRGDMSIVGPRPHMIKHTEAYSALIERYMVRHTIKPGITGWAQVNGYRGLTDQLWKMEKRVECDVWYTENWNFMLDLKIMLLTVVNVFRGEKNAF